MSRPALLALTLALVVGCGDEFTNAVFETDQAFLDAVPRARDLRLNGTTLTDGVLQQALVGQRAELYSITRATTLQIDRVVFHQLRDIERLVDEPPSERADDRRAWGPFRHPLDDFESRFVMTRDDLGFAYAYEARIDDGEFTAVIDGRFQPEGPRAGTGEMTFDVADGAFSVSYALDETGGVDIAMASVDGNFAYRREADTSGEFEMAVRGEEGETFEMRTRWVAGGSGRADARSSKNEAVVVSECWDDAFGRTWYDVGLLSEGDVETCAFQDAALPERVTLP